jgi:ELWxxDGT repeat protein
MIRQTVLFGGYDASGAAGLWATNGTTAGTYEVTGFVQSSIPASGFTVFNGEVFYQGGDAVGGDGLWSTDGTAAGTTELGGIGDAGISGVGVGGLDPSWLTVLRNAPAFKTLLFVGQDSGGDSGLWVSNGTAAGTSELGGVGSIGISGAQHLGLDPSGLTLFMPNFDFSEMMFAGRGADGPSGLWVTDGTAAGTSELTGISGAHADGSPSGFVFLGVREDSG